MGAIAELGRGVAEERIRLAADRGHAPTRLGPVPGDPRFGCVCSCGWSVYRGDGTHKVGKVKRQLAIAELITHLLEVTSDVARDTYVAHADRFLEERDRNRVSIPENVAPEV